jgi:hypothetical protein
MGEHKCGVYTTNSNNQYYTINKVSKMATNNNVFIEINSN